MDTIDNQTTIVAQDILDNLAQEVPPLRLTPRQLEVGKLLAEGLSNKLIGVRLSIADHTVKFHTRDLYKKLGVSTRAGAVAKLVRAGMA